MAGNVRKLDTISFNETINNYAKHITTFENIFRDVDRAVDIAIAHWRGKGRDAFEIDCEQVKINLQDISDIMYDMRDALIEAHAQYMETDMALEKSFET